MTEVSLEEVKRHVAATGIPEDDPLLEGFLGVAEEYVKDYVRRDLDTEPGRWPLACRQAVKLLVAHWYQNREAVSPESGERIPLGVADLLAPHRDLS